jgi:dihydrofolate reductase
MGKVVLNAAVSLDGFVAMDDDLPGPIFDWYGNGPVPVHLGDERRVFHVSQATAGFLDEMRESTAASVIGRRLFDLVDGWGGRPPAGRHVVVVTHRPADDWAWKDTAPFTFAGGVEEAVAIAKEHAGGGDVAITAGDVGGQALRLGLVDQVVMNLAPVVLGSGRPFFGTGSLTEPIELEDPRVVVGDRVTHLVFDVRRGRPANPRTGPGYVED